MGAEGVSKPQLLCRTSSFRLAGSIIACQSSLRGMGAHTERFIESLWNVEPDDFDGNFPTLEHALKYLGWVGVLRRLQGLFTVVLEFH